MENSAKERKINYRAWAQWLVPVTLSILVTIATYFHGWIESIFSTGIYPYIAQAQRYLTGWLPFSIGDWLYLFAGGWFLYVVILTIIAAWRRKITRRKTLLRTFRLARGLMWLYIIFNLTWGWNYHRLGLDHQLQLENRPYKAAEVRALLSDVIRKMNDNRRLLSSDTVLPTYSLGQLAKGSVSAYRLAASRYAFLQYSQPSIKPSIYSATAQYFGFTGYYNPFTGEAQLRTRIPEVMKPFILCHEIGHQLGYAKEFEASFAGYLSAASSVDPYFRYSVYLDLYVSVRSKLVFTSLSEGDTTIVSQLPQINQQLDTLVRYDRRKIREYFNASQTPFSEQMSSMVMNMYGQYLRANQQAAGLQSYDDVVSLLILFKRKWGYI